ncbi:hypothetical protein [Nocardia sp. CA-120079]
MGWTSPTPTGFSEPDIRVVIGAAVAINTAIMQVKSTTVLDLIP